MLVREPMTMPVPEVMPVTVSVKMLAKLVRKPIVPPQGGYWLVL